MKYIKEYVKFALLPKELRNSNLLYHSTEFKVFEKILKDNILYGTSDYDYGISTSRNKHYAFGRQDDEWAAGHNLGHIQIILDKDKIHTKCKIVPFDWENSKIDTYRVGGLKSKTGKYNNYHQSEDKILCDNNELTNLSDYIVGLHVIDDKYLDATLNNPNIKKGWYIFNENWNIMK
jgi:hypothetical protein